MDITSLLEEAFFAADEKSATSAIEQARALVSEQAKVDAFSLEVVVPENPDDQWLHERVLHPLIYFCQSIGAPPPNCAGVFVTFFSRGRVHCVLGAEIVAWADHELGLDAQALVDLYGTGERQRAAPRAPA